MTSTRLRFWQRFRNALSALWGERRTYTGQLERELELERETTRLLRKQVLKLQKARLADQQRFVDFVTLHAKGTPVYQEQEHEETLVDERSPIEDIEESRSRARLVRQQQRLAYADANELTYTAVCEMSSAGLLPDLYK